KTIHANAATGEAKLAQTLRNRICPAATLGANVTHPFLGGTPTFDEGRHHDKARRIAIAWKDEHVELGVAPDRTEIAGIGSAEIPDRWPSPQDKAIKLAGIHLAPYGTPAAITLGERKTWQFELLTHGLSVLSHCLRECA